MSRVRSALPNSGPTCVRNQTELASPCVKQQSVNLEEKIDRIVGRRLKSPDPLSIKNSNKAASIAWRKALGGVRIPRGVHRFHTHEEADEWLWRMISRPNPS